jgi:magnesium transporter
VGAFEHQLDENVLLAFFVPGIVYMADAVGTQTEALVIRGLSVGVPVGRIIGRELLTGLLVGVLLAAAFLPVGLVLWDEDDVIVAVAIALLAACSTATVVAMALPWVLSRLGRDPAFGSGPPGHRDPGPAVPRHLLLGGSADRVTAIGPFGTGPLSGAPPMLHMWAGR